MLKLTASLSVGMTLLCYSSNAQDIQERFAHFQLQKAQISEGMSVLIEKVNVTDQMELVPEVELGAPPKYRRELSSKRTLQRVVFGANGQRRRMDAIAYSLFGGGADLAKLEHEAQLVHENEGWYCAQRGSLPKKKFERFQVKAGIVPMTTDTRWKHPFDIAMSQAGGMRGDEESMLSQQSYTILEEETLKDGRTKLGVFNNLGAVYQMTFNKEEGWFTEEIAFLLKEKTREEEIAEVQSGKKKLYTKELISDTLKDYRLYATNRTEWKEVEPNHWVPWVTRISSDIKDRKVEFEIRFRDWKFENDIDKSLLDEESFTPEKILASIDFKAVRDLFDSTK